MSCSCKARIEGYLQEKVVNSLDSQKCYIVLVFSFFFLAMIARVKGARPSLIRKD